MTDVPNTTKSLFLAYMVNLDLSTLETKSDNKIRNILP